MSCVQRSFIIVGLVQILIAMVIPFFTALSVAKFAVIMLHIIGPIQGVLYIGLAYVWPYVKLPRLASILTVISIHVALISNLFGTFLSAFWGTGRDEFVIKSHIEALPVMHGGWNTLTLLNFNLSEYIIFGVAATLYGFCAAKKGTKKVKNGKAVNIIFTLLFIIFLLFILLQTFYPRLSNL